MKNKMWKSIFATFAVGALLAGCSTGGSGDEATELPFDTITDGRLTVATEFGFPPFRYLEDDGTPVGLEVELLEQISERIGISKDKIDWINTTFDAVIPGVAAGKFDVVADAVYGWATPDSPSYARVQERIQLVSFSRPWFFPSYVILTSKTHSPGINSADDFTAGMSISANDGGSEILWAEKVLLPKGVEVKARKNLAEAVPAIEGGLLTGTIEELAVGVELQKEHPDIQIGDVIPEISSAGFSFIFGPDNVELREAWDKAFADMIADGSWAALYKKYMPDLPIQDLPETSFYYQG
ncbi:MAG: amino acid ABC transporter substrate-binding protein [Microbacteriaceae bacterium]|nr:amino acid ABC transporter substrate-binding protein [Microbacteriaceae bacterium]